MTKRVTTIAVAFLAFAGAFAGQERTLDDFPIAENLYKDGSRLFHLHTTYGFIAKWEGGGNATFFLYDKARSNISTTVSFVTFLDQLSKIPENSEVAWVNTCGAPLHYGMPVEMLSRIEDMLKKRRFRMAGVEENNFALCTCEATSLIFFKGRSLDPARR